MILLGLIITVINTTIAAVSVILTYPLASVAAAIPGLPTIVIPLIKLVPTSV